MTLDRLDARRSAEAYAALPRPAFTRLPFDYRHIPLSARVAALSVINRLQENTAAFPEWPIEQSLDAGRQVSDRRQSAALILTHDVDSRQELDQIEDFRRLERELGVPSAWGFVPDVSWPAEDVVRSLIEDGCEPYWHDIRHDGRLAYRPIDEIRAEFERVAAESRWAVELLQTFRSGQLLMSRDLLTVVRERFSVDLSIPDTERAGPYGGTAGCGTVRPFSIGGLVEIPLTLPQDVFVRHVYGFDATACLRLWQEKVEHIRSVGGVAVLNTHPVWSGPGHPDMWGTYRAFIEWCLGLNDLDITTPQLLAQRLREAHAA